MLRLSANIMYQVSKMISYLNDFSFDNVQELRSIVSANNDYAEIVSFAIDCGWLLKEGNKPILTQRGLEINKFNPKAGYEERIRLMIEDYIISAKPIWMYRIPYGRKEASTFMTKDEISCFNEANLLGDNPDLSSIDWWDNLSLMIRNDSNLKNNQTGRDGEKLTLQYEEHRTKRKAIWQSIDSNMSGYDVISIVSETDNRKLLIEVKTSTECVDSAYFHISKNEWNVANSSDNYLFYLWILNNDKIYLAKLNVDDVSLQVPTDNNDGEWENVKIPFSIYKDRFIEIKVEDII